MADSKKNFPGEAETMRLEDGFDVLNAIVGCLSQSKEWERIQRQDPLIQKAEDALYQKLEQIKTTSGESCSFEMEATIGTYTAILNEAAILFGLRMAVKLFYAFGRPLEMSQYVLTRDAQKNVGVCYGQAD